MKRKVLLVLSLFALAGCRNRTPSATPSISPSVSVSPSTSASPRRFRLMYKDLQGQLTASGTIVQTVKSKSADKSSEVRYTLETKMSDTSYHVKWTTDDPAGSDVESYVYTTAEGDDKGKALHYYLTGMNEVAYEVIKDKKKNVILFDNFANPFKSITADNWVRDDKDKHIYNYDLDIGKKEDAALLFHNIAYMNINGDQVESVRLITTSEKVTELELKTKEVTDTLGTNSFVVRIALDFEHDATTPLPTPKPTLEYHKTLANALDELKITPFAIEGESRYSNGQVFPYYTYQGKDFIYSLDKSSDGVTALLQREDGVHEVVRKGDKSGYSVKSDIVINYFDQNDPEAFGQPLKDLSLFRPKNNVAVQFFTYDENTKVYTLTGAGAGAFGVGYHLNFYLAYDWDIYASTKAEVTLTEDNLHIKSMVFSGSSSTYTMNFKLNAPAPFDSAALPEYKPADSIMGFAGIYTFKFDDNSEVKLTVSKDGTSIKWNEEECTDLGISSYNEVTFTHGTNKYSISTRKKKIYNETDFSKSYSYTFTALPE